MKNLKNFIYNSEDKILDKILAPYAPFFTLKELFDGDNTITDKIKSLKIKDFLNLQRIILQEKTFITENGKSIPYVSVLDVFNYYDLLEYEKKSPGRYTRIAHSIKLIENLGTKFIELNSQLFNELMESEDLINKFLQEYEQEIKEFSTENSLTKKEFINKVRNKIEQIKERWNELSIQEMISLKKNEYNLKDFNSYC